MKTSQIRVEDIVNGYLPVRQLYDYIRLVDPIKKRVEINVYPQLEGEAQEEAACYDFWHQNKMCENCISVRAHQADDTLVKIEFNGSRLFLITAVTLAVDGNKRVLELLKDITENGFLNINGKDAHEVSHMVKHINDLIVRDMMTGSFNKQYAYERLPHDLTVCLDQGLTVIFATIDNLELVKRDYGYAAGDQLAKQLALIIMEYSQRWQDSWLARLGETEFLLVLPHIKLDEAQEICTQIEAKLKAEKLDWQGSMLRLQASLGIHQVKATDQELAGQSLTMFIDTGIALAREKAREKRVIPLYDSFFAGFSLSKRECEVAELLLEGRPNEDIARALFIGLPTVKKHLTSIYGKSQTNSRSEFLALYHNYQVSYLG